MGVRSLGKCSFSGKQQVFLSQICKWLQVAAVSCRVVGGLHTLSGLSFWHWHKIWTCLGRYALPYHWLSPPLYSRMQWLEWLGAKSLTSDLSKRIDFYTSSSKANEAVNMHLHRNLWKNLICLGHPIHLIYLIETHFKVSITGFLIWKIDFYQPDEE